MAASSEKWNEWSLKVLEELTTLNNRYDQLTKDIESQQSQFDKSLEAVQLNLGNKIDKMNELMNGNGTPEKGIIIRLDRLEQSESRRTWLLRTTLISCIGAIVATIAQWIKS
jgi:hypothetical protein